MRQVKGQNPGSASLLLVGLLGGCANPRTWTEQDTRHRGSLSTVSLDDFVYVGMGSMGRVTDYDRHPTLPDVLAAGSDVGGVFLSVDGGESWTNVTRDMPSLGSWTVRFVTETEGDAETTRLVVGGDSGIFVSADMDSSDGLSADELTGWSPVAGLDLGDELPSSTVMSKLAPYHGSQHALTVFTLAVAPSDPSFVWAASAANAQINLAQSAKDPASLQRFERWKVFRSSDGGKTFAPALRLSEPIADFVATPFDGAGSVFSILVNPDDAGEVWVATDRGLYHSQDADSTTDADGDGHPEMRWEELGSADNARSSDDLGVTWTSATASCSDYEDGSTVGAWCLPVQSNAKVRFLLDPETGWPAPGYEDHPNLRGLSLATVDGVETLYAAVWDRGHAEDGHADCSDLVDGDYFVDSDLEYYRGGIYASEDGGQTWRWLLSSNGAPGTDPDATPLLTDRVYRCDATTSERNSDLKISFFSDVDASPDTSEGPLLLASGMGAGAGLYAYDGSAWTWLTDSTASDWTDRFEGGQELAISGTSSAEVSRLLVDWDTRAEGWPALMFGHRGILQGSWDSTDGRYEFEHLGSEYLGDEDGMTLWAGTGLDDAVAWEVVDAGDYLYVGVSDGGLFRAEEVEGQLQYVNLAAYHWTPNWSDDPVDLRKDEVRALAYDSESGTVYAGNFVTSLTTGSQVLAGSGTDWEIIGGFGYTTDSALAGSTALSDLNGLYTGSPRSRMEYNRMVAIPASDGLDTDLLAATSDGVWAWDREATAGSQWSQVCADITDADSFSDLAYDADLLPGYVFAVNEDHRIGGLVVIRLSDLSCQTLEVRAYYDYGSTTLTTGKDPLRYGYSVALAQDAASGEARLVVGVTYSGYPVLLSAEPSCDADGCSVDAWDVVWTGEGLYSSGSRYDLALKRDQILDIVVDPTDKTVVGAALGTTPGTDYYNPEWMLWSEDGGASVAEVGFADDDHGLPNRGLKRLSFSSDGSWLYAVSSSSVYRMPVGW